MNVLMQKEQLGRMLDEDPMLMEKKETLSKRLHLYKSARDEIDSVSWKWESKRLASSRLQICTTNSLYFHTS